MKNFSAKNKIITVAIGWLFVSAAMFFYFFNILNAQNQQALDSMAKDRSTLVVLDSENQSFKLAQQDLQELAAKNYQPDNFFSKDTSFVNEIQTLEDLSSKYNLKMELSGISGTVGSANLAQTVTPIVTVPYGISLAGDLNNVVAFMENLENLPFVTTVTGVNLSAGAAGQVNANLAAVFYLRR